MSLVVNGITIPIVVSGHTGRHVPMAPTGRNYGGVAVSAITGNRGHYRSWAFRTADLPLATIESIETELDAYGVLTATGSLVGTETVMCRATNVRRLVSRSLEWAALSFELAEDDPAYAMEGAVAIEGADAETGVFYPGMAGAGTMPALTAAGLAIYGVNAAGAGTLAAITGDATMSYAAP